MFSEAQYTDTEILIYSYFVDQKPVQEEEKNPSFFTCVYEENGVYYCASTTQNGVYWYAYCLNNPLIYTDPSGDLFWIIPNVGWSRDGGFSLGVSVVVGLPGIWSAQTGVGYNFGTSETGGSAYGYVGVTAATVTASASYSTSGGFSVGVSAGTTVFSGLPISTNFGSVGLNYNISNNSLSGNVSAWQIDQNGVRFNPSVSAMIFPEQTTNLFRAGKFMNNEQLFGYYVSDGKYQTALDKFGFKGTYDPNHPYFAENCYPGRTDEYTGDIYYNETAFDGGYDKLYATWDHEMSHRSDVLSGRIDYDNLSMSAYESEVKAYGKNIRHEGMYKNHGFEFVSEINRFGSLSGNMLYLQDVAWMPSPYQTFMYRIPRRW